MSLFSVVFWVSCFLMFKLGGYAERNPGQIWETGKQTAVWFAGLAKLGLGVLFGRHRISDLKEER